MYALKYFDKNCISWKEFYGQCKKFIDDCSMDCCTQEDFVDACHPNKINAYDFMESQEEFSELIINIVSPKEAEEIEAKCKEQYNMAYDDAVEECRENWGWM